MERTIAFGPLTIAYDALVLEPRQWTTIQSEWARELLATAPPGPVLELCTGAGHIGLLAVTGTTRDPATPYEWAVALADQLESGVLVSRDGDGHTGYNSGNECVDGAVESYLVEGTVPADGTEC